MFWTMYSLYLLGAVIWISFGVYYTGIEIGFNNYEYVLNGKCDQRVWYEEGDTILSYAMILCGPLVVPKYLSGEHYQNGKDNWSLIRGGTKKQKMLWMLEGKI